MEFYTKMFLDSQFRCYLSVLLCLLIAEIVTCVAPWFNLNSSLLNSSYHSYLSTLNNKLTSEDFGVDVNIMGALCS